MSLSCLYRPWLFSPPAVNRTHLGPYCYTCPVMPKPDYCEHVSICGPSQVCGLYSTSHSRGTTYTTACLPKPMCDTIAKEGSDLACQPTCCDVDFCNTNCNMSVPDRLSITPAYTCDTDGGYTSIAEGLCVRVHTEHALGWNRARDTCKNESSDLVMPDTPQKAEALRNYLNKNYSHVTFWAGGSDRYHNNTFYWMSGQPFRPDVDWDSSMNQPNNMNSNGHPEDCVAMYDGSDRYHLHDIFCRSHHNFICQRN